MRRSISVAVVATLVGAAVATPAAAQPPTEKPATEPRTVTLVTGDRVTVAQRGGKWDVQVEAAGADQGFLKHSGPHGVTVIPTTVAPLVHAGKLDRALFDVTGLIKQGYDDAHTPEIPLLVESSGAKALGKVTRELAGLSAVTIPKNKTAGLLRNAGDAKIWLNKKMHPSLDVSVPQIGAPTAWQAGHTGAGATIAVLDTGYDPKHPDLAGIVKAEKDFTGEGIVDNEGHGTHVASIAAGRHTKYTGVARESNLLVGKVCGRGGCYDDAVIEGVQWAVDNGARVVNMSLGRPRGDGTDPVELAINRLSAQHGTLFVASAGNDGDVLSVSTPATADAALAVGSVSKQDQISDFSSHGPRLRDNAVKPDIAAPGGEIVAARAAGTLNEEAVDEHHARLSGTSMAAPHVAGAAAILAAQHPDWNGERIKTALMSTANPVAASVFQQGAGRVDVARATSQTVTASPGSLSLGEIKFPYNGPPVTKPVTYRNTGATPVTLSLKVEIPDTTAFRTDVNQITVPAQGEATVNVTMTPMADAATRYSGWLVASAGNTVVRTAIGGLKEPERYDLTLRTTDRNGAATSDATGFLLFLDDQFGWYETFTGNQTFRLPPGRYAVMTTVRTPVAGQPLPSRTSIVEPLIDLRKDTVANLDARRGNQIKVDVEERGAKRSAGAAGIRFDDGIVGVDMTTPLTDASYAVPAKSDLFTHYVRAQLTGTGYRYELAFPHRGGIPADVRYRVRNRDLATVKATYHGGTGNGVKEHVAKFGDTVLDSYRYPAAVAIPAAQTEYYSAGVQWLHYLMVTGANGLTYRLDHESVTYQPGEHRSLTWNKAVGPNLAGPTPPFRRSSNHAYRQGDQIMVALPMFSDSAGHSGYPEPVDRGAVTLYVDGILVGQSSRPGFATLFGRAEPKTYRMTADATRTHPDWPLSTSVSAEWTFRSERVSTPTALPLLTTSIDPKLDLAGNAPGGRPFTFPVHVARAFGTTGPTGTVDKVEVSYDDGVTWQQATLAKINDQWCAAVRHPAAGFVSVRTSASDPDGNTVSQTIIRAYQVK